MPRISAGHAGEADGHVGAEPGGELVPGDGVRRARGWPRRTARSSAAASAEPPPSPAATGRFFSSSTVPSCSPASSSRRERQRPLQQVRRRRCRGRTARRSSPGSRGPACSVTRSPTSAKVTRLSMLVVAVGAPAEHGQRQVDLGAGDLADWHGGSSAPVGSAPRAPLETRPRAAAPSHWKNGKLGCVTSLLFLALLGPLLHLLGALDLARLGRRPAGPSAASS